MNYTFIIIVRFSFRNELISHAECLVISIFKPGWYLADFQLFQCKDRLFCFFLGGGGFYLQIKIE